MKSWIWLATLIAAVAACGDGDPVTDDVEIDADDQIVEDAASDAPAVRTCDPLTQTPCSSGERCTWIWDSVNDPSTPDPELTEGHLGCVANGSIPAAGHCIRSGPTTTPLDARACTTDPECEPGLSCITGACRTRGAGAGVEDDCERGTYCLAGTCKQICDDDGGAPSCSPNFSCNRYSGIFVRMGQPLAGLCDPKCDPLRQTTDEDELEACNSLEPSNPNTGCYITAGTRTMGMGFSCSRVPPESKGRTDNTPAFGPADGAYANGCEAGYLPFWPDAGDESVTKCAGVCAPADSDNSTPGFRDAAVGDRLKAAKLPGQPTSRVGDGVCEPLKKGSAGDSNCVYLWLNNTSLEGDIFVDNVFNDTVGTCFVYSDYRYDNDGDPVTPDILYPGCEELPPPEGDSTSTVHGVFAWELGCYSLARTLPFLDDSDRASAKQLRLRLHRFRTVTSQPGQRVMKHVLL